MAKNQATTTTKPPSAEARNSERKPAAKEPQPIRLISRHGELRIADLVRFQGGRATVTNDVFEQLQSRPEYGYGVDFHLDSTPPVTPSVSLTSPTPSEGQASDPGKDANPATSPATSPDTKPVTAPDAQTTGAASGTATAATTRAAKAGA